MKILIIEDDPNIRDLLTIYLKKEGHKVSCSDNGLQGIRDFDSINPELILLDVMLPTMNGFQVCTEIRKTSQVPIIFITAKGETTHKVEGLEVGGDDYIVKPLDMREVIARINAVSRRISPTLKEKLIFDNLSIDKSSYVVLSKNKKIDMPPKEIELLFTLASTPNKVFTRSELLDEIWGFEYFGDTRTVDVHIKRLREKLDSLSDKWSVQTVWGVGYKFELLDI